MTQPIQPQKYADVDPNFQRQVTQLKDTAAQEWSQANQAGQVRWMRPILGGYGGDLWDWEGMKEPFQREQANQWYLDATSDPLKPGRVGDAMITTTQIDYLAAMERAYRARHTMSFPRAVAQHTGRRRFGHAVDKGVFLRGVLEYVRDLIKQTSD